MRRWKLLICVVAKRRVASDWASSNPRTSGSRDGSGRSTTVTVRYGSIDYRTQVTGTWPSYPLVRNWNVASGGFFTKNDLFSCHKRLSLI